MNLWVEYPKGAGRIWMLRLLDGTNYRIDQSKAVIVDATMFAVWLLIYPKRAKLLGRTYTLEAAKALAEEHAGPARLLAMVGEKS